MIELTVDEAYAFDFLSILKVKSNRRREAMPAYEDCRINLMRQLGERKFIEVECSTDYLNLIQANSTLFDAIDLVKLNKATANDLDELNYKRFLLKKALQKKFFENEVQEIKIGYT